MSDQPDPREEPKAIIGYHGGLWSVKLSHGHYAQYIPDFRSKEDAQFYVDAKLREWGYEPQQQRIAALEQALRAMLADDGAAFKERDCCYFCDAALFAEAHREDCPVLAAKALLDKS